jgi:hypothetical protein
MSVPPVAVLGHYWNVMWHLLNRYANSSLGKVILH